MPVVPATWEAEAEKSPEPTVLQPGQRNGDAVSKKINNLKIKNKGKEETMVVKGYKEGKISWFKVDGIQI